MATEAMPPAGAIFLAATLMVAALKLIPPV